MAWSHQLETSGLPGLPLCHHSRRILLGTCCTWSIVPPYWDHPRRARQRRRWKMEDGYTNLGFQNSIGFLPKSKNIQCSLRGAHFWCISNRMAILSWSVSRWVEILQLIYPDVRFATSVCMSFSHQSKGYFKWEAANCSRLLQVLLNHLVLIKNSRKFRING